MLQSVIDLDILFNNKTAHHQGLYEIHTCNTFCSASSPVITSTLSNRIFSTGLEIPAAADSISVVFLNKAVPVGGKKKGNPFYTGNIFRKKNLAHRMASVIPVVSGII